VGLSGGAPSLLGPLQPAEGGPAGLVGGRSWESSKAWLQFQPGQSSCWSSHLTLVHPGTFNQCQGTRHPGFLQHCPPPLWEVLSPSTGNPAPDPPSPVHVLTDPPSSAPVGEVLRRDFPGRITSHLPSVKQTLTRKNQSGYPQL
jgi:hypothetical protein